MGKKEELLKAIANVNRGLAATEDQRKAIFSATAYLESANPNPSPNQLPHLLSGDWRLLFTTSDELLGLNRLPGFKLGQIYQCIRAEAGKIYNVAEVNSITGLTPFSGLVSVCANFTAAAENADRRVKVNFERFVISTQWLLGYQQVKPYVDLLQTDKRLWAIDFAIKNPNQRGWLETTYLDQDVRIGRGNEGSLFILAKN
ncbi:PAP fibrillin family protein [Thalassoporum mexicanum PCC 7367]|uniref:PAP/fibrillin family protein n=1 Tax=Thalassoporum mexicanum TaxID=3457544 RepID=UPI00029FC2B0|nr:PAP/fibrillin family protein [Pseudanabaena sp. PCC 7367]AFY69094.1 PAP fibrillin family protein [Pseudanabaena sp. PCC 7367]